MASIAKKGRRAGREGERDLKRGKPTEGNGNMPRARGRKAVMKDCAFFVQRRGCKCALGNNMKPKSARTWEEWMGNVMMSEADALS